MTSNSFQALDDEEKSEASKGVSPVVASSNSNTFVSQQRKVTDSAMTLHQFMGRAADGPSNSIDSPRLGKGENAASEKVRMDAAKQAEIERAAKSASMAPKPKPMGFDLASTAVSPHPRIPVSSDSIRVSGLRDLNGEPLARKGPNGELEKDVAAMGSDAVAAVNPPSPPECQAGADAPKGADGSLGANSGGTGSVAANGKGESEADVIQKLSNLQGGPESWSLISSEGVTLTLDNADLSKEELAELAKDPAAMEAHRRKYWGGGSTSRRDADVASAPMQGGGQEAEEKVSNEDEADKSSSSGAATSPPTFLQATEDSAAEEKDGEVDGAKAKAVATMAGKSTSKTTTARPSRAAIDAKSKVAHSATAKSVTQSSAKKVIAKRAGATAAAPQAKRSSSRINHGERGVAGRGGGRSGGRGGVGVVGGRGSR